MELVGEEIDYTFVIQKVLVLLFCVGLSWKMIIYMCNLLNIEKDPIRVLITGAAGNVNQILNFTSFCLLKTETKQSVFAFVYLSLFIYPYLCSLFLI